MQFDHIVIGCEDLDQGTAWVEQRLGVKIPPTIGKHALMGTHNRLLSLGGVEYLEVIAIDPEAPKPPHRRWFGLDDFAGQPRLIAWVCAVTRGDAAEERPRIASWPHRASEALRTAGHIQPEVDEPEPDWTEGIAHPLQPEELLPGAGRILDFQRGAYRWQMAVPEDGHLPFDGLQPAQILWQSRRPALQLPPSPCRLAQLIATHPDVTAVKDRLSGITDPRLSLMPSDKVELRASLHTPNGLRLL